MNFKSMLIGFGLCIFLLVLLFVGLVGHDVALLSGGWHWVYGSTSVVRLMCSGDDFEVQGNRLIEDCRSMLMVTKVILEYRMTHPVSTVPDEKIIEVIDGSDIELVFGERAIAIKMYSENPILASDLANAYAEAIVKQDGELRKEERKKALARVHENVATHCRYMEQIKKDLFDRRNSGRTNDVGYVALERQLTVAEESMKQLAAEEKNAVGSVVGSVGDRVVRGRWAEVDSENRVWRRKRRVQHHLR